MSRLIDGIVTSAILGVLMMTVVVGAVSIYAMMEKMDNPIEINFQDMQEVYLTDEVRDITMFIERFAQNHQYNITGYNCVNYSSDVMMVAEHLGFDDRLEMVSGCNATECHRWLRIKIDFEPQTATFVDYSKKYKNQRVVG